MKKVLIGVGSLVVAIALINFFMRPTAKVVAVTKDRAISLIPGSVTVRAEYQMELKSETSGRVIKSELDPGEPVKTGQVLVQLDPADLDLEIEHIQSEYDAKKKSIAVGSSIKLQLQNAQDALENHERLTKAGNYPQAELEKERRDVKQIEQRLELEKVTNEKEIEAFENTLKVKRRQRDKMTITAQFDGVVSQVYARPGDLIGQSAAIAIIISSSRTVEAKISEENFSGIKIGQKASVRFLGYGTKIYEAKVTKILPTADPETQRYIVHLEVKIEPEKLVPGLTGEVLITVGEREGQAIIPRRGLFGNNVFVVEDGRVRLRTVEVGYVSLTAVEILKGLKPGEMVIVEQLDRFRDGERVRTEVVPAM